MQKKKKVKNVETLETMFPSMMEEYGNKKKFVEIPNKKSRDNDADFPIKSRKGKRKRKNKRKGKDKGSAFQGGFM